MIPKGANTRMTPRSRLGAMAAWMLAHTVVRFIGVGVWNAVFSTVCYACIFHLLFGGRHYMAALVVSTILGVTNAFVCHRWFTFRSRAPMLRAYLRFYVVYGFQIGATFVLLPVCVEWLRLPPVLAQIVIAVLTTVLTYAGHKRYSFQLDPPENQCATQGDRMDEVDAMHTMTGAEQTVAPVRIMPLWVILGGSLLLGYLTCFVAPIFLNDADAMAFPRYLPAMNPIGVDLRLPYDFSRAWFNGDALPVPSLVYPPLERVLRLPLVIFPFRWAYVIQTLVSVFAYLAVLMALPLAVSRKADRCALVLLAMAGFMSYGFQFEVERGQSNVIAIALVAWALLLFHRGKGTAVRVTAYFLFTCAIQLKLYPAVFVFGFTQDARDWRGNLMRWGTLGALNVAGLFALGLSPFRAFVTAATTVASDSAGIFNHSIASFGGMVQKLVNGHTPANYHPAEVMGVAAHVRGGMPAAWQHCAGRMAEIGGLTVLTACFGLVLVLAFRRNARSAFKYVMTLCALVALLAPVVSMDYKLSILVMAFAFFVGESDPVRVEGRLGIFRAGLLVAISTLLALTLFPPEFRPVVLCSSTPLLLGMAVGLALLMAVDEVDNGRRGRLPAGPGELSAGGSGDDTRNRN